MFAALVLLAGCRTETNHSHTGEVVVEDDLSDAAGVVFEAADSALPPTARDTAVHEEDCANIVPAADVDAEATVALDLTGDFDFDGNGLLVSWDETHLVGYTAGGDPHRIARNVAQGGAGLRRLPSGDLIVAVPDSGVLRIVDHDTGTSSTIVGGLLRPTGLEVGQDGIAYASETIAQGSVRWIDPYTGENAFVAELPFPSALALSPDEASLYVVTRSRETSAIVAVDRADEGWSPTVREIWRGPEEITALATDVCGHLYVVEDTGAVLRIRATDGSVELLARFGDQPSILGAARFGNDRGDFRADRLYVAARNRIRVLDIGVAGRQVLGE